MNQFGSIGGFPMMGGNQAAMYGGQQVPHGAMGGGPHFGQPNPVGLHFNPMAQHHGGIRHPMGGPMASLQTNQPSLSSSTGSSIGQKTNATDLYSRQSRVYVGSVSPKLSREQLISIFSKYGKVTGLSLLKGFAFVQYDNPTSARTAVSRENSKFYSGMSFECNVVSDEKKSNLPQQGGASGTASGAALNKGRLTGPQQSSTANLSQNVRRPNVAAATTTATTTTTTTTATSAPSGSALHRNASAPTEPTSSPVVSNLKRVAVSTATTKSIQPPAKKAAVATNKPQPQQQQQQKPKVPVASGKKVNKSQVPAISETKQRADLLFCGQCRAFFDDVASFQQHKDGSCGKVPDVLWCFSCSQTFTSPWALLRHAQNDHDFQLYKTCDVRTCSSAAAESLEKTGSEQQSYEEKPLPPDHDGNGRTCDKFNRHSRSEDSNSTCTDKADSLVDETSNPANRASSNDATGGVIDEDILLAEKDDMSDV